MVEVARYEFMTSGWVAAVGVILDELAADLDLNGVDFTVSEEFTDPPQDLAALSPTQLVGWHLRIRGGAIEVSDHPLPAADVRIIADYATHRDLTRRLWAGDSSAIDASRQLRERATLDGRLTVRGDLSAAPPVVVTLVRALHDPVAAITE